MEVYKPNIRKRILDEGFSKKDTERIIRIIDAETSKHGILHLMYSINSSFLMLIGIVYLVKVLLIAFS